MDGGGKKKKSVLGGGGYLRLCCHPSGLLLAPLISFRASSSVFSWLVFAAHLEWLLYYLL